MNLRTDSKGDRKILFFLPCVLLIFPVCGMRMELRLCNKCTPKEHEQRKKAPSSTFRSLPPKLTLPLMPHLPPSFFCDPFCSPFCIFPFRIRHPCPGIKKASERTVHEEQMTKSHKRTITASAYGIPVPSVADRQNKRSLPKKGPMSLSRPAISVFLRTSRTRCTEG